MSGPVAITASRSSVAVTPVTTSRPASSPASRPTFAGAETPRPTSSKRGSVTSWRRARRPRLPGPTWATLVGESDCVMRTCWTVVRSLVQGAVRELAVGLVVDVEPAEALAQPSEVVDVGRALDVVGVPGTVDVVDAPAQVGVVGPLQLGQLSLVLAGLTGVDVHHDQLRHLVEPLVGRVGELDEAEHVER